MMGSRKQQLDLGELDNGKRLLLPLDAVAETFAVMGIRRAGKTTTTKRMAEEMCRCGLPWIAFDPVGVWWGLRAKADGTPSELPVVVFGGKHGDLPLERTAGKKIARAIVRENICAVIDVFGESKAFWRTFFVDFCLELMELEPDEPRHVFIEEAKNFCPQRARTDLTARTKEAIERLVSQGGNQGYGCTLITQRPATVDKDVLSQCENLFVLRTPAPHDRKALKEWLDAHESEEEMLKGVGKLKAGEAYFWSPVWLECFEHVQIAQAETHHPGRTRRVGARAVQVELGDVATFVRRLERQLKIVAPSAPAPRRAGEAKSTASPSSVKAQERDNALQLEIEHLKQEVTVAQESTGASRREVDALRSRLTRVAKQLKPFADAYRLATEDAGGVTVGGDRSVFEPWLHKAGKPGAKRRQMLEVLLEHGERTRAQLATLSQTRQSSSTFRNGLSWLKTHGLIVVSGDRVRLAEVA